MRIHDALPSPFRGLSIFLAHRHQIFVPSQAFWTLYLSDADPDPAFSRSLIARLAVILLRFSNHLSTSCFVLRDSVPNSYFDHSSNTFHI